MAGKPIITASVREVVTFVLRTGDLSGGAGFGGRNRALEGTRGHQRLQKKRPLGYQPEVCVSWQYEENDFSFELKGRIDGVLVQNGSLLVEEIKTVHRRWNGPGDPLHWGQAKLYAYLYAAEHRFTDGRIQITYVELKSGDVVVFDEFFKTEALKEFFDSVLGEYLAWVRRQGAWRKARDQSIKELAFPFSFRVGQRTLAVAAYRAIKTRGKLFVEAPTGIGKTLSVLFPAIKAIGEGAVERIFYLTAKTIGRTVAHDTMGLLRGSGLRARSVTITAKEKICFKQGERCDISACPYALGYYDRVKTAMLAALNRDALTQTDIEEIAREYQVCPFELSLDVSRWADIVICDYNYVFDPSASLKRYFDGEKHDYAILVDESHNLLDRGREMFSAELSRLQLFDLKQSIGEALPACAKALGRIIRVFSGFARQEGWSEREGALVATGAPAKLTKPVEEFLDAAEVWLAQEEPASFREALLETYFRALGFQKTLENYDDCFVTVYEQDACRLRLYCVDPAKLLREALHRTGAAVFFSATLRPLDYFRRALGGENVDSILALESPFSRDNLSVLVAERISTRFRERGATYDSVVASIRAFIAPREGNYLVYLPSYSYLAEIAERFRIACPEVNVNVQSPGMTEPEREDFVNRFRANPEGHLVGLAVLGGVFGEGIDLVGDRLIGVAVVGVGLPQICLDRDLIKERSGTAGFDYAYKFPGINRVLQAVGRVVRTAHDRGVILLIDDRYRQQQYRRLFPSWWQTTSMRNADEIASAAARFWENTPTPALTSRQMVTLDSRESK